MGGGLGVLRLDTQDLGFEQCDPLHQLILRIAIEILFRQEACRIGTDSRKIVAIHRLATSQSDCLLSMAPAKWGTAKTSGDVQGKGVP
jgi:hypothetical protein